MWTEFMYKSMQYKFNDKQENGWITEPSKWSVQWTSEQTCDQNREDGKVVNVIEEVITDYRT